MAVASVKGGLELALMSQGLSGAAGLFSLEHLLASLPAPLFPSPPWLETGALEALLSPIVILVLTSSCSPRPGAGQRQRMSRNWEPEIPDGEYMGPSLPGSDRCLDGAQPGLRGPHPGLVSTKHSRPYLLGTAAPEAEPSIQVLAGSFNVALVCEVSSCEGD